MKLPLTTHATPPSPSTSSIDSTAPYTSSRKRKLDDSVASPDTHSFGEDGGNGQNGRRIRSQPATGPMDEAGMFSTIVRGLANILGWQSAGTAGHPPSEAPVEVSEEQQDNSEASDEDQRVGIHVNADDDHASPTSSRQLKISIPKQEYGGPRRDELAKKKPQAAPAPQQLPSPLASEDETPVKSLLGKNPSTKKSQQTSRRPVDQVDDSIRFEAARRPFVPKALSEKAFSQVLEEARKRRDKQQEGIITSPALFHLLHTNLSPQTGTPRRRKNLQSPKSTSMGATFSRLVAWRAPIAAPSPVLRRCEKVTGKITKPSPKKRSWSHKIEQAKSNGKAADEQLKAYMAYIQGSL
ncbi:hypothetical protein FPQ18DRAFT_97985 [Pyronema domesticum]|nr:hypothetical protein FPQ18DRAFT_97985 [Pyronema domesticum]